MAMIGTLLRQRKYFKKPLIWNRYNLKNKLYAVLTLHRPSNVDEKNTLKNILKSIMNNLNDIPVVFPVHPRTKKNIDMLDIKFDNLYFINLYLI